MDIYQFWKDVLEQKAENIRKYFDKDAYINWHCTNEHFTVDEFVTANCEYPGSWRGEVERVHETEGMFVTVTHVYSAGQERSFHVTSFMKVIDDKIAAMDEYWADDGPPPAWRREKQIGKAIGKAAETRMRVIGLESSGRPEYWLEQIGKSGWSAGQLLYELLRDGRFKETLGEKARVLMLTDGEELVSFCTYAEKDDIPTAALTPWMGFVYTFPRYRGHRYVGKLFREIEKLAKAEGVRAVYISTDHVGLYEKYGCEFYRMMQDIHGVPSRVYRKCVN